MHVFTLQYDDDDENLNITGYNENFSITSWIEQKLSPLHYRPIHGSICIKESINQGIKMKILYCTITIVVNLKSNYKILGDISY